MLSEPAMREKVRGVWRDGIQSKNRDADEPPQEFGVTEIPS